MKKIGLLVLISLMSQFIIAHNYTSTTGGGNWNSSGTWVGGFIPGSSDTANIAGPVTVAVTQAVNRVIVNSGKTLTIGTGAPLYVYGEIVNNGTVYAAYSVLQLWGSNQTVIAGAGTWTGPNFYLEFYGVQQTIDSTVFWNSCGPIYLETTYLNPSVINRGKIYFYPSAYVIQSVGGHPNSFTNGKNATILFDGGGLANSYDTLHASAMGNLCAWIGTSYTIKKPYGNQYYNLQFQSTILIPSNLSLNNLTVNSSTTLNLQGYNLSLTGNWVDNGSVTNNTGTITFDAIGSQCIERPSGTETFKNVTVARTSKLGKNCAVTITGALNVQAGGFMDCTCP